MNAASARPVPRDRLEIAVVAFARVREILGSSHLRLELPAGARAGDVWAELVRRAPELAALTDSTRLARNGRVAEAGETLRDGDEIALLPPPGGG